MIRHFNYTDRQKITRDRIQFSWIENDGQPLSFQVDRLDLELERSLNPQGLVFIEAYSGPQNVRFSFGSVEFREDPPDTFLTEFPRGLRPHLRVKVVDPGDERIVLARADALTPLTPEEVESGRKSILPVETVDLGQKVWDLRIEENSFRLQLNEHIREPQDITILARGPDFISLVYPAVIRRILTHLLFGPERDSVEEDHDWLVYSAKLAGTPGPRLEEGADEDEDYRSDSENWIEDVIEGFCEAHEAADSMVEFRKELERGNN